MYAIPLIVAATALSKRLGRPRPAPAMCGRGGPWEASERHGRYRPTGSGLGALACHPWSTLRWGQVWSGFRAPGHALVTATGPHR